MPSKKLAVKKFIKTLSVAPYQTALPSTSALTAEYLYKEEKLSVNEILDQLAIGRATLYRYLKYRNVPVSASTQRKTTKHEIIEIV